MEYSFMAINVFVGPQRCILLLLLLLVHGCVAYKILLKLLPHWLEECWWRHTEMMRWLLKYTSGRSFIFDASVSPRPPVTRRQRCRRRRRRRLPRCKKKGEKNNESERAKKREKKKKKKWRALISSEKMVLYVISSSSLVCHVHFYPRISLYFR